jgi:hypothetical protein
MNKCEETGRERDLNHRFWETGCKKYAAFSEGVAGFWDIPPRGSFETAEEYE